MTDTVEHFDLSNCDREPIHLLGAIQPVGFLIVVSTDWIVARASKNVGTFLGVEARSLIGNPLSDFVPPKLVHDLRNRVAFLTSPDTVERQFGCQLREHGEPFDIAVHFSDGQIVIEAEPGNHGNGDATGAVRSMMGRLDAQGEMASFYREGARQVRALLGYDRVMVYKFAPDGAGEVVAEACKSGIGSFKGLHYPASDIPRQARALYKRNLIRVIRDVNATPVGIEPALDENRKPLDLSLSVLRSVSPIHIEYLKNMGVEASLSISIIVDDELWGLFACHHYSPRAPTFERRSVTEMFAQMFSMRLESRERRALVEYERRARDVSDQLLGAVASDETLLNDPDWLADILTSTIPADGVGVWINGSYAFSGTTPPTDDFRRIIRALNGTAAGKVFATDHIGSLVDHAAPFARQASGLLAIPISRSPRDYVVLFRSEMRDSVRWGLAGGSSAAGARRCRRQEQPRRRPAGRRRALRARSARADRRSRAAGRRRQAADGHGRAGGARPRCPRSRGGNDGAADARRWRDRRRRGRPASSCRAPLRRAPAWPRHESLRRSINACRRAVGAGAAGRTARCGGTHLLRRRPAASICRASTADPDTASR